MGILWYLLYAYYRSKASKLIIVCIPNEVEYIRRISYLAHLIKI